MRAARGEAGPLGSGPTARDARRAVFCGPTARAARAECIFIHTGLLNKIADASDSEEEILLLGYLFYRQQNVARNRRRMWVHDTIKKQKKLGEYHRLVQELT